MLQYIVIRHIVSQSVWRAATRVDLQSISVPRNRLSLALFLDPLSSGELICWHGNQNANGCERRTHSLEIQKAQPAACNHEQILDAVLTLLNFQAD